MNRTIATFRLIGLQLAVPIGAVIVYSVWASLQLASDINAAISAGRTDLLQGQLPSWGYVEAVGTIAPLLLMLYLTPYIWKAGAPERLPAGVSTSSRLLLGCTWGYMIFM